MDGNPMLLATSISTISSKDFREDTKTDLIVLIDTV